MCWGDACTGAHRGVLTAPCAAFWSGQEGSMLLRSSAHLAINLHLRNSLVHVLKRERGHAGRRVDAELGHELCAL